MKIKVGQNWGANLTRDISRVCRLRELAGDDVELMVDANGGYSVAQARRAGAAFDDLGVVWFEEPVSSDDIDGLRVVRDAVRCDIAAGEYVSDRYDARRLAPVVDCLQLDATRCGGYTGWLRRRCDRRVAQPAGVRALRTRVARSGRRLGHESAPCRVLHRPHPVGAETVQGPTPCGERCARRQHDRPRSRYVGGRQRRGVPAMSTNHASSHDPRARGHQGQSSCFVRRGEPLY